MKTKISDQFEIELNVIALKDIDKGEMITLPIEVMNLWNYLELQGMK